MIERRVTELERRVSALEDAWDADEAASYRKQRLDQINGAWVASERGRESDRPTSQGECSVEEMIQRLLEESQALARHALMVLERSRSPEIPESDDEALHQQVAELKKRISEIEKFVLESKEGMKSASNLFSFLLSRGRR